MSLIWYPGDCIERFFCDEIIEEAPTRLLRQDGRVYLNDKREGAIPWDGSSESAFPCRYVRPTEVLSSLWKSQVGSQPFTLEINPWDNGRTILIARGRIPTLHVCLQDPNYTGFRRDEIVEAKFWDGMYYPATIAGLYIKEWSTTYRVLFSKLPRIDPEKGRTHSYADVLPEHIRRVACLEHSQ